MKKRDLDPILRDFIKSTYSADLSAATRPAEGEPSPTIQSAWTFLSRDWWDRWPNRLAMAGVVCALLGVIVTPLVWIGSSRSASNRAVTNCLALIRRCNLPDGAIRVKADGDAVWVSPYFGNYASLALLAGKDPADIPRVLNWQRWFAVRQAADGSIHNFECKLGAVAIGGYRDIGQRDSSAACAGTFLMVLDEYRKAAKTVPGDVTQAATKSIKAIKLLVDDDGLVWSKPDSNIKFLMTNLEVLGGLVAAEGFFASQGDKGSSTSAHQMALKLSASLPKFRNKDVGLFAYLCQ